MAAPRRRDNNSSVGERRNNELTIRGQRKISMPIINRSIAATDLARTEAILSTVHYTGRDLKAIDITHDQTQPAKKISLITCKADKMFVVQIASPNESEATTICRLDNESATLQVSLYEERYCIDLREGAGNILLRRWSFFLATNNGLQARAARNLWNHLCSAFNFIPPTLLQPMNFKPEFRSPQYNLRSTMSSPAATTPEGAHDNVWTIQGDRRQSYWSFTGFLGKNKKRLEAAVSGMVYDEEQGDTSSGREHRTGRGRSRGRGRGRGRGRSRARVSG